MFLFCLPFSLNVSLLRPRIQVPTFCGPFSSLENGENDAAPPPAPAL